MVDLLRVQTMLHRLGLEIEALRRLSGRSADELLGDEDLLAAVKYRFVVAIEVCVDLGRHIVASEGLRAPLDYADVFSALAEAGLLPAATAATLRDTARFRNLLVHGYATIDDSRVVEILKTRVDDLAGFRSALARAAAG
ncbi:DUF86 domain-containing protein [Pseudonocardia halophobica]|uniref:DUF86 domain-containing protein n=2 Tax=Pseudonocardia halophobica TaxID=29401 RepID=A0A9W6NVY0_9PSEU|nr:DUF86 domain-containing protein [Pseudonocardia halophobica]GLL10842.1 hypothetical protein GCM10017577_19830 [Pseudonocardia halophobica]